MLFSRRVLLACAVLLAGSIVYAAPPAADTQALSRELMSPFCPGLLLSDCQSAAAGELRAEIRARLEAGEAEREIVDDLVARFGPGVRGRPEPRGLGLLIWVGPAVLGLAMLLAVVWRLRSSIARASDTQAGAAVPEDPVIAARIDEELYAVD